MPIKHNFPAAMNSLHQAADALKAEVDKAAQARADLEQSVVAFQDLASRVQLAGVELLDRYRKLCSRHRSELCTAVRHAHFEPAGERPSASGGTLKLWRNRESGAVFEGTSRPSARRSIPWWSAFKGWPACG